MIDKKDEVKEGEEFTTDFLAKFLRDSDSDESLINHLISYSHASALNGNYVYPLHELIGLIQKTKDAKFRFADWLLDEGDFSNEEEATNESVQELISILKGMNAECMANVLGSKQKVQ